MDPRMMMSMFQGGGGQGFGGFGGANNQGGGIGQILSGLFSNSDKPYREAGKTLEDYLGRGINAQNPFYNAGTGAIPQYQEWLQGQKDPSGFINNLMGQYQESPWAKYQQDQAMRAAQNQGSASGLTGSTPLMQFAQQNAHNISQQDMGNWLQNVLGINTQYGAGQQGLVQGGQNAANNMSNMYSQFGGDIAKARFGEQNERNQNRNSIWSGGLNMLTHGLFG